MKTSGSQVAVAFLLMLPFVIKLEELRLSGLGIAQVWPGLLDPAVVVLGWMYGLSVLRGGARALWLVVLVLVDLLLLVGLIGYNHFGGYYRPELFASQSFGRTLGNAWTFITSQVTVSLVPIFAGAVLLALSGTWVLARLHSPRGTARLLHASAGLVVLYGTAVVLLAPPRVEALRLSLAVTASSILDRKAPSPPLDWSTVVPIETSVPAPMPPPYRAEPYNLVVYVMESTRASVMQVNGSLAEATPFLDTMVRRGQGVFFDRAYTVAARSIKGLTATVLNTYPRMSIGAWSWPENVGLVRESQSLPGILKEEGYLTAFYVNSTVDFDNRHEFLPKTGFEVIEGTDEFVPDDDGPVVDRMIDYLGHAQSVDRPLFTMLLSATAHVPYKHPPDDAHAMEVDLGIAALEAERLGMSGSGAAEDYLRYLRSVRHQDDIARQLYERLEAEGLLENTIFVVMSDHGQTFGEHLDRNGLRIHGQSLYEESVRVPVWMHHPRMTGIRMDSPVQLLDLAPTWLAMLGIETDVEFVGRNVFAAPREELFFANFTQWPAFGLLRGTRKMICNELPLEPGRCELYDVFADPFERTPLSPHDDDFTPMYQRLVDARSEVLALQRERDESLREPLDGLSTLEPR
ncbi:LTA synthase family protein [Gilvimarinus sp. DZF01]|uniref:LTA synthase family protein n=1 Tax=Gilvimarinus sp. DZF01 TaxID=3461371 RepID=UPI0040455A28